ncbi:MAG TPA: TIGR01459 family HAD-type hydrolase [Rhizobiaceae bacterium]|nr:TIGR01459 family HAD-type hydrolase [Rhizobiaceae bacterium]
MLAADHDAFPIDQFGGLHDGQRPYPGAVEALRFLRGRGKRVALISNSGKRAGPNIARMEKLGFARDLYDAFVTSGEVAHAAIAEMQADGRLRRGCRTLLLARDGDTSAVEGLGLADARDGLDAELVLLAGSRGDEFELDHYRALLEPAARRGVPMICSNPDKVMLTKVGMRFGAGAIADLYVELGGVVASYGKPLPPIYAAARRALGDPAPHCILCIGDSVEHDIAGGAGAGFRTVLVRTGILADVADAALSAHFAQHGATPDYILPAFSLSQTG